MVLEAFMPFEPGEVAKIPIYSDIVMSASSKYRSYDTLTDENTNNLRLSLLLCMIASKKCFEVMGDVFEDGDYYENKIKKIDQLIMGLYIAEENTVTFRTDDIPAIHESIVSPNKRISELMIIRRILARRNHFNSLFR